MDNFIDGKLIISADVATPKGNNLPAYLQHIRGEVYKVLDGYSYLLVDNVKATIESGTCTPKNISPWLLAEMALEVANYLPDDAQSQASQPRACWRHKVVNLAERCIRECNITPETDDIDEVFVNWLAKETSYS